jgi:CheY-like chemotaxis protein
VSNAVKFTNKGEIEFAAALGGFDKASNKVEVRFSLRDTGVGIQPEDLGRIFLPFIQADSTLSRVHGGTGLGLTIVKQLIELMDGYIEVESTPRIGTTFVWNVWLSRDTERIEKDVKEHKEGMKRSNGPLKGSRSANGNSSNENNGFPTPIKVLVVEDNEFNREIIKKMLRSLKFRVKTANDGFAAVEMIKRTRFDVILMDFQMPRMDGLETSRLIRKMGIVTPIIGLTANADESSRKGATSAGMSTVLTKPMRLNDLKFTILEVQRRYVEDHLEEPVEEPVQA